MERTKVGEVFHFYGKIGVAAIRLTDGTLAIGDTVQIQGPTTNIEQTVDTLQIEHADVAYAERGQEVGMKVRDRVREKDFVFKVLEETMPEAMKPVQVKPAKKAPAKKAAAKKRPVRKGRVKKARVKKASRARRSTARRGSRGSRRRSR